MRKQNVAKLTKALEKIGNSPFSIADVCELSGVSDPTVRSFLKSCNIREVSYGQYQIINPSTLTQATEKAPKQTPKKSQTDTPIKEEYMNKAKSQPTNTSATSSKNGQVTNENQAPKNEVIGEIYLNAYLKGFDRGFELGLQKASTLKSKEALLERTSN